MKYYIATGSERAAVHNVVRDELAKLGHEITCDWTLYGSLRQTSKSRLQEGAHEMMDGILTADFVLVLLPGGKGTHVELGFALAHGKKVIIHSEDPLFFELGPQVCAFYHQREVERIVCPAIEVAERLSQSFLRC